MRRTLLALGLTGALAVAGCGAPAAAVSDEAIALQQVGFETGLVDTPSADASAGDAPRKALRKYLRRNTLHGEVVIQTKKSGAKTVVVQRGSVTAVDKDSVSVKSADGFTLTWKFGDKLRVVQDRKQVESSALKTGTEIGIAGTRDGDVTSARLIAIK
ncbi:hypothetical protein [Paractinoplanes toevensis]|uniref:DUF5666 domain-containing protein n=1 Tax=Paractinoplanes toevensis TaxID=571911 RepID=A0A920BP90_9ACTN|nr:hypothetical protein [Actinoplanes toevensis]GIM96597.1 hypothetical protein Ato02nite_083900 [Actinoplanes toevensis]